MEDVGIDVVKEAKRVKRFLRRRFGDITVSGLEHLRKVEDDALLFYISTHKSHIDYLVMGLVLFEGELKVPSFIAGDNLKKGPFGRYLEDLGAFFIDRENTTSEYLDGKCEELADGMRAGKHPALFSEAGRSYEGEIKRPRSWFVKAAVWVQKEGKRPVYLVPAPVSYELVLEDFELKSLVEEDRKETAKDFRDIISSRNKGGKIYVDFGEPIPVRGFLDDSISDRRMAKRAGKYAFDRAKRLYRVTAPALVAASVDGAGRFTINELASRVRENLRAFVEGANLEAVSKPLNQVVSEGLTLLGKRKIITNGSEGYSVQDPWRVSYYANTIKHLL